jgi:WD40 repeat protein
LQGGAYRILSVIGSGGFSLTYIAEQRSPRVRVAIKELFPRGCVRRGLNVAIGPGWDLASFQCALEDFIREGQVIKLFDHPSIVQCYSPFEEHATAYTAMELLEGESLLHQLGHRGSMNQQQALEVATQLGGALEQIHTCDVVHSDIKPENVIYTEQGKFVLLDFGVSRRQSPGRLSKLAIVAVSPGYSPPEQYLGSKPLTPATDVYSLAATLYTVLSLTVPPESILRAKGAALKSLRELNSTVTASFWATLESAMDLDPAKRPQSIESFVSRLTCETPQALQTVSQLAGARAESFRVEKLAEFSAHRGGMHSLLLHTGHPILVSGGRDGTAGMWSWQGEPLGALTLHDRALCGFAMSQDGKLLATAGEPGEVKLWNALEGELLLILRTGLPAVRALAVSNRHVVAVATSEGTIQFFEPGQSKPLVMFGHLSDIDCLCVNSTGTMLASAGQDGLIQIWDFVAYKKIAQYVGHSRRVLHMQFSPDSRLLLSAAGDYTTRIWELEAGSEMRLYRERASIIQAACFTSDPDIMVTAGADRKLRFYRISTARQVGVVDSDNQCLRSVVSDPNRPLVATAGGDGLIRVWRFGV